MKEVIHFVGGNSLAPQWLGLHAFTAEGEGLIPVQGTKIPEAAQPVNKKRNKHVVGGNEDKSQMRWFFPLN